MATHGDEIIHFNRIVQKEIEGLGVDMEDMRVWNAIQKIVLAAVDYASEFHRQVVKF